MTVTNEQAEDAKNHIEEVKAELIRILDATPGTDHIVIRLDNELFDQAVRMFVEAGAPDETYSDISLVLADGRAATFSRVDLPD